MRRFKIPALWVEIKNYLVNTTVHGLKYLAQPGRHWLERLFWLIAFLMSGLFCYYVQIAILDAFQHHAVSFVPETRYLNWKTGFPSITVCESKNSLKIWKLAKGLVEGGNIAKLSTYLGQMIYFKGTCDMCDRFCKHSLPCPLNIMELANEVISNCTSLLGECTWNGIAFDCCSNFYPQITSYGKCYVINSLHTKNMSGTKDYLMSDKTTGPGNLKFKIYQAAQIHVHSPEDIVYFGYEGGPEIKNFVLGISYTFNFRIIEIVNDPQISELSINQRECILPQENPLKMYRLYSSSACIIECQARAQLMLCGCNHHYTPKVKGLTKVCDLKGIFCLHKYANFLNAMDAQGSEKLNISCNCAIPSCTEPEYSFLNTKVVELDGEDWSSVELSMISLPTERYRRNVVRSKLDLVVSTGGTAGLFFGASILSTLELIMYFCIILKKWKIISRTDRK